MEKTSTGGNGKTQVLLPRFRHAELVSASIFLRGPTLDLVKWILKQVQHDEGLRLNLPEETLSYLALHCFDPPQGGGGDAIREQAGERKVTRSVARYYPNPMQ